MYVLKCCIAASDVDSPSLQWLHGRLRTMNQLLETHHTKFSACHIQKHELAELADELLLPMVGFGVMSVTKAPNQPRTIRYAKKVIVQCSK